MDNRLVFIFGASRSGTTFLASMLGDSEISIATPELQFLYKIIDKLGCNINNEIDCSELLSDLTNDYSFCNLGFTKSELELIKFDITSRNASKLATFIDIILNNYASKNNKGANVFFENSPVSRRYVGQLLQIFPNSKFIHIVRDPRGVFSSIRKLNWGPNTALFFCKWWNNCILECILAEINYKKVVKRVRYEDLLLRPDDNLKTLCNYSEISYSKNMMHGNGIVVSDYTKAQHELVGKNIVLDNISSWKYKITYEEDCVIQKKCGFVANNLGYNLTEKSDISVFYLLVDFFIEFFSKFKYRNSQQKKRNVVVSKYKSKL